MGASIQYSPEMDGEERSVIWVKFLSSHILVMGNVITVRLQEGDYGNPFVLNYMPKWGNGRPSRLKICRLQRRASSTLALGTKKIK